MENWQVCIVLYKPRDYESMSILPPGQKTVRSSCFLTWWQNRQEVKGALVVSRQVNELRGVCGGDGVKSVVCR